MSVYYGMGQYGYALPSLLLSSGNFLRSIFLELKFLSEDMRQHAMKINNFLNQDETSLLLLLISGGKQVSLYPPWLRRCLSLCVLGKSLVSHWSLGLV